MYGVGDQEPQTELVAQLSQEMYNNNMLFLLIQNLHKVDFEVILDVWKVMIYLFQWKLKGNIFLPIYIYIHLDNIQAYGLYYYIPFPTSFWNFCIQNLFHYLWIDRISKNRLGLYFFGIFVKCWFNNLGISKTIIFEMTSMKILD